MTFLVAFFEKWYQKSLLERLESWSIITNFLWSFSCVRVYYRSYLHISKYFSLKNSNSKYSCVKKGITERKKTHTILILTWKFSSKLVGEKGKEQYPNPECWSPHGQGNFLCYFRIQISVNDRPAEETKAMWMISQQPTQEKYLSSLKGGTRILVDTVLP